MRILYLDLDTLRPDHLGCYGYHRPTSPNLDWIASQGVRFDNYYCSDAPCLPSRAALISGRFGIHNGVINHGGVCADRPPDGSDRSFRDSFAGGGSLFNVLRDAGLRTAYVGGFGERHSAYWWYAGFHEVFDTARGGMESAEEVTPAALTGSAATPAATTGTCTSTTGTPTRPTAPRPRSATRSPANPCPRGSRRASSPAIATTSARTARGRSTCSTTPSTPATPAIPAACRTWMACGR
jgi:hypothetical protein